MKGPFVYMYRVSAYSETVQKCLPTNPMFMVLIFVFFSFRNTLGLRLVPARTKHASEDVPARWGLRDRETETETLAQAQSRVQATKNTSEQSIHVRFAIVVRAHLVRSLPFFICFVVSLTQMPSCDRNHSSIRITIPRCMYVTPCMFVKFMTVRLV